MESLSNFLTYIADDIIWSPILVILLFGTGLYLTIGMRFLSFKNLPKAFKLAFTKSDDTAEGDVSPRAALFTALSATVGTGNIAGVATAIALGGPGAIFWMWMTALVGMATKYAEALLAVRYREHGEQGEHIGGPMYYIKNGLGPKWKWLAWLFAICTGIAALGTGNLIQANEVTSVLRENFGIAPWLTGIALTALTFVVIIGGIKSIAAVADKVVPAMAGLYFLAAFIVIAANYANIPHALALIFSGAFSGHAAAGGFLGSAMMFAIQKGADRGSFSNEAGLGSAAIAHASAQTQDPTQQGTIAMLGTFIDTLVVCTLTALVILTAPAIFSYTDSAGVVTNGMEAWQSDIGAAARSSGAVLTSAGFEAGFDKIGLPIGQWVVSIALAIFAFTTILGWALYGERAMQFMFGVKAIMPYRIIWCLTVLGGCLLVYTNDGPGRAIAWSLASIGNGMMAGPNLIALVALSGTVFALARFGKEKRPIQEYDESAHAKGLYSTRGIETPLDPTDDD